METLFSKVGTADIHQDLVRNIVSLRVSKDLFADLSDNPDDWRHAIKLEDVTRPGLFVSPTPIIHRPFEDADWNNAIGYPFKHASQSRFSDGSYGVWYGADTVETTVHETVYHWRNKFLADAGFDVPGIVNERKVYHVRCDSMLLDLRPAIKSHPEIVHPHDYTATHAIGNKMHREGQPGLVTHSARAKGDVYAIFNPVGLSSPRHVYYLTYMTTEKGVVIQRAEGVEWFTV